MTDADGFVWGETLDLFLGIFNESELYHLLEKEMDNIGREVTSYRCFNLFYQIIVILQILS